ncbi:L-histidine N(alpha)-methyltransferase [Methanolobus sp. ZRKC3]|uniref:L-histidine N(alpha)-methyltransferase n=1 Tax=Methanolobus sp. ZRKC3 TaxID=3125786 RepID=UPI00324A928C
MKKIELLSEEQLQQRLCDNLTKHELPDLFLYVGEEGASNWLTLDSSDKFTVARKLTELLRSNVSRIVEFIPGHGSLVSVGVGNGEKERIILKASLSSNDPPFYYPIDVSSQLVDTALESVKDLPVEKTGMVGMIEDLALLRENWISPALFCILGNTFCNYDPDRILGLLHENLFESDIFLFDCHLLTDSDASSQEIEDVEDIYRSEENKMFNAHPLINAGMTAENIEFDLRLLPVESEIGAIYRTHKTLTIKRNDSVDLCSKKISFEAGDVIHMGFTYKYSFEQVASYLEKWGFGIIEQFFDVDGSNVLLLTRKLSEKNNSGE